jgi:hypothetical protein
MPGSEGVPHESGTRREKIKIVQQNAFGLLWFGSWLFTIGYLHLPFWKAVIAVVVWPYYLGGAFATPLPR